MIEPTKVCLPSSILYPVEVTGIVEGTGTAIRKQQTILRYKYWKSDTGRDENGEEVADGDDDHHQLVKEYHSTFESPIDGEISEWTVKVGDQIRDSSQPVVTIVENCTHSVQYGGLCAICGQPVADQQDYSEFSNRDRAPIAMSHDTSGLKVSYNEAERIEKGATATLLSQRKLILVVDLDQTIIHAAVEPTIGEWMADPNSPNHEAVANVKTFTLEEEVVVAPRYEGPRPPPSICRYYVKLRPGLDKFLRAMCALYEMHIYTMATKAYAKAIAALIDPNGEYFGDRILSRDESGSVVQKSLKRLFPVSTSMVAIIDDRGDVWRWKPNLIKVLPYNFFVGIGDINSSFLPQRNGAAVMKSMKRRPQAGAAIDAGDKLSDVASEDHADSADEKIGETNHSENDKAVEEASDISDNKQNNKVKEDRGDNADNAEDEEEAEERAEEMAATMEAMDESPELLEVQATQRSALIEKQQHDRPLAKLQRELGKSDHVLHDDDKELENLEAALRRVHAEFFKDYDAMRKNGSNPTSRRRRSTYSRSRSQSIVLENVSSSHGGDSGDSSAGSMGSNNMVPRMDDVRIPDVAEILTHLREQVFEGCVFLLSGWLPRGINLDTADIVLWMRSFGAVVVAELVDSVTHVVATNGGTEKVRQAAGYGHIKIVYTDWVYACIAAWKRVPEDEYYISVPNAIPRSPKRVAVDRLPADDDDTAIEESETPAPETVARFVRSLSHGDVWAEVDKELEEFMGSEDDSSDDEGDVEDEERETTAENEGHVTQNGQDAGTSRKRSRSATPERGVQDEASKRIRHYDIPDNDEDDDDNDFDVDDDKFAEQLANDLL